MGDHSWSAGLEAGDEPFADDVGRHNRAVARVAKALRERGFSVKRDAGVHPYVNVRADVYAEMPGGPRIVVEVKSLPPTDGVSIDHVQQVEGMARVMSSHKRQPVTGLLVSDGRFSGLVRGYAGSCTPPIHLASPDEVGGVVDGLLPCAASAQGPVAASR